MSSSLGKSPSEGLPDGLPAPRRYWAAGTVLVGIGLSVLDATIANVALPTITADLNVQPSQTLWIINAYNLAVVMLLLPLSALAERVGFRRMFSYGLVLFTLASLGCALSTSLVQLTAARILQGVGAASLMCMFGGLVRHIYPLRMLGRGLSINAIMVALMSVLGPTIGSAILSFASWPWIFAVNIPICLIAMAGLRHLPEVPRSIARLDWISAVLSMVVLGVFITGIDVMGADLPRGIGLVAVAAVVAIGLVRRSLAQPAPLVPVDLLRIQPLSFAVAASACTFAAQMAAYVALPFYFEHTFGRPINDVGILMAAWPAGTVLTAPLAGRLSDRYSAATLSGLGALAMVLGLLWLIFLPTDASNARIMVGMGAAGIGFGFFQIPNNRALLTNAPRLRSGAAGGLQATTRVFGQSFGTALAAIGFSRGVSQGSTWALSFAVLCAVLAVGVNMVRLKAVKPNP